MIKTFNRCTPQILQLFFEHSLQSMVQDTLKGIKIKLFSVKFRRKCVSCNCTLKIYYTWVLMFTRVASGPGISGNLKKSGIFMKLGKSGNFTCTKQISQKFVQFIQDSFKWWTRIICWIYCPCLFNLVYPLIICFSWFIFCIAKFVRCCTHAWI